jgi:hypothetical protein
MWPDFGPTRNTRPSSYRCSVPGLAGFAVDSVVRSPKSDKLSIKLNSEKFFGSQHNTPPKEKGKRPKDTSRFRLYLFTSILNIWRRGWDSNPRYGSPHTAFPVLPIQPLLHLSA